jgi:broad specificity phosphatase PhoE
MVRHAQSEANVASARLENGEVSAIWGFLTMGSDAPLSDMGRQQLAAARVQLMGSRFIEERGVQLIAHSPLVRAQQTAHALFDECGVPFVELPFVRSRRRPSSRLHTRVRPHAPPRTPLRRCTSGPRASG